jgi:hypothetical protein
LLTLNFFAQFSRVRLVVNLDPALGKDRIEDFRAIKSSRELGGFNF